MMALMHFIATFLAATATTVLGENAGVRGKHGAAVAQGVGGAMRPYDPADSTSSHQQQQQQQQPHLAAHGRQLARTDKTFSFQQEAHVTFNWRRVGCSVRNEVSFTAEHSNNKFVTDGVADKHLDNYATLYVDLYSDCDDNSATRTWIDFSSDSGKERLLKLAKNARSASFAGSMNVTVVTEVCGKFCNGNDCNYGNCTMISNDPAIATIDATWTAIPNIVPTSSSSTDKYRAPEYNGRQASKSLQRPATASLSVTLSNIGAVRILPNAKHTGHIQQDSSSSSYTDTTV